jgi:hypothetical protein
MAKKAFALNTEPHVADIGGTELPFKPEVMGDDFMDAYTELRDTQQSGGVDVDDLSGVAPAPLRQVSRALRSFLAHLMLEESAESFTRLDVVKAGDTLKSFTGLVEAEAYAAKAGSGARVVDALRLPDSAHAVSQAEQRFVDRLCKIGQHRALPTAVHRHVRRSDESEARSAPGR